MNIEQLIAQKVDKKGGKTYYVGGYVRDLFLNKRLDALDFNKETYNPQHIMAERDIEREKLIEGKMYKDILLKLWTMKTKDEKQELISKFIESATLKKNENGGFTIENFN